MVSPKFLQDTPLGEKIIKKGFWLYFFVYLGAPMGYLTRVIISNSLPVDQVGLFYSILSLAIILSLYNDLGLTSSIKYFLPSFLIKKDVDRAKTIVARSLGAQILTGMIIALALFLGSNRLASYYFNAIGVANILKMFSVYFLCINILQVFSAISLSLQDTFYSELVTFLRGVSVFLLVGGFFLFDASSIGNYTMSYIIGVLIATSIALGIYVYRYKNIFVGGNIIYDQKLMHKYLHYSIWTFISINATLLLTQVDQQMSIFFIGPDAAGIFSNYIGLFNIQQIFIGPIIGLIFPIFSELAAKKQKENSKQLFSLLQTYLVLLSLFFAIFVVALGPQIAATLYGVKFTASGTLLYLGGVSLILQTIVSINFLLLAGYGKAKSRGLALLGVGIFNVIANYILIGWRGLEGIVIATILSSCLLTILSRILVRQIHQDTVLDTKIFIKNIIILVPCFLLLYILGKKIIILDNIYRYQNLLYLLIMGISYGLVLLLYNYKDTKKFYTYIKTII